MLLSLLLLITPLAGFAQYFSNPSFEGPPAMHRPPPGWTTCHPLSTPDTQPGQWGVSDKASQGKTFMSMVTRGPWGGNANTTEDAQAELLEPLRVDDCYKFYIDLATCDGCGHTSDIGYISYASPTILKIWGGAEPCQKTELLAISEPVTHHDWQTYEFLLVPEMGSIRYLILEVDYVNLPEYFGSLFVDNIRISKVKNTFVMLDMVVNEDEPVVLNASTGHTYYWIPQSGLSCFECQMPVAQILESTSYVVIIRDSGSCPRKEIFNLWLESFVFVPNAFTPGNDGLNDRFGPVFTGNLVSMDFRIFNRWGQEVFFSANPSGYWDGNIRGRPAAADVYYWVLDYRVHEYQGVVRKQKKGMLTLVR